MREKKVMVEKLNEKEWKEEIPMDLLQLGFWKPQL
jgi:hypothetical protein